MQQHPKTTPMLEFDRVTFKYQKNGKSLLSEINLKLMPGQRIGIIGDNGCGKSTLSKLLLGFYNPDGGSVKLFGHKACWGNHYPEVGYIGDPSYNPGGLGLPLNISVGALIESFKKLWADVNQDCYFEFEERLALQDFYTTDVAELSKGQRMRVMAFLALMKRPKLLIADEATEGLDRDSREAVLVAIKQASSDPDFGMLWISHRRHEVTILSNEVYELADGKLNLKSMQGFNCSLETHPEIKNCQQSYCALGKDDALEIVSEIFTNSQISKFHLIGERQN